MTTEHLDIQDPGLWGPMLWHTLHTFAANYPVYFVKPKLVSSDLLAPKNATPAATTPTIGVPTLANYDAIRQKYVVFFETLADMLPCGQCREHYAKFYQDNPIKTYLTMLPGQPKLDEWVNKLHNSVNQQQKSPEWSIEQVRAKYDNTKTYQVAPFDESAQPGNSQTVANADGKKIVTIRRINRTLGGHIVNGIVPKNIPTSSATSSVFTGNVGNLFHQMHQGKRLLPPPTTAIKNGRTLKTVTVSTPVPKTLGLVGTKGKTIKKSCGAAPKKKCGCRR